MSPQPSPLSLGHPLRPSPALNTPANSPNDNPNHDASMSGPHKVSIRHEANQLSQSITLPPLRALHPPHVEIQRTPSYAPTGPPTVSRLDTLCEFLSPRFHNPMRIKVIALDGEDADAVSTMIEKLQHRVIEDLHYTVRVLDQDRRRVSHLQSTELSSFRGSIECWKFFWDIMLQASSSIGNPGLRAVPSSQSIPHTATFDQKPCVYILPLSPLMATIRASKSAKLEYNPPSII